MTDTVTVVRLSGRTVGVRVDGQRGTDGADGVDGLDGTDGASLVLLGELDDVGDLPVDGAAGDLWFVDAHLWAWDDDEELWIDCGDFRGAPGADGDSFVPDPTAEPDDRWLTTLGGALVYTDAPDGGGAVDSVNGQDGVVVLDATDVGADAAGAAAAAQAAAEATAAAGLAGHTGDSSAAHAASAIGFTPTGTLAATDVQAAVAEAASEAAAAVATEITARDAAIAAAIAALINSAPGLLDTLDEIAAALGDDPNFAATMTTTLAGKQPLDAELTALAGLASAANKLPYFSGSGTATMADFTAFARSLLDDADATAARATLGLVIGTDVQGFDPDLAAIGALASAANKLAYATGSGTWSLTDLSAFARTLLDDGDAATMRATLGVDASGTAVLKTLYDANSILIATTDDTPVALTVAASRIVGRKASGDIVALTGAEAGAIIGSSGGLTVTAAKTANYTAAAGDYVPANAAGGAFTVTLPASPSAGTVVGVKKTDATTNAVTVASSALVDGFASVKLTEEHSALLLIYSGSTWYRQTTLGTVALVPTSPGGVSWPFWLRASTLALANNASITTWADLGTGNTPASGGTSPTYKTGVMGTNLRPAASFNGSSQYLASARDASARPRTIFAVVQFVDFSTRSVIGNSTGSGGRSLRGNSTHMDLLNSQAALIGSNTSALSTATPYIIAVTVDGSGNWAYRVNNVADGSGSGGAAFTASRTSLIGASTTPVPAVAEFMNGYIAEILEADSVLSSGDLTAVYNDLSAYYGI